MLLPPTIFLICPLCLSLSSALYLVSMSRWLCLTSGSVSSVTSILSMSGGTLSHEQQKQNWIDRECTCLQQEASHHQFRQTCCICTLGEWGRSLRFSRTCCLICSRYCTTRNGRKCKGKRKGKSFENPAHKIGTISLHRGRFHKPKWPAVETFSLSNQTIITQRRYLVYWTAQQRHALLLDRRIVLLYIYGM